ncbi:protein tyrosine phosphatase [Ochrobactrum soli]|uniref:Dual specificity protein phosphatase family protein n=2 Tax=Ochrobactrum TaxID=528 RepID=A0ABD5JYF8_9HYPH|nr:MULTISPECIES: dual specificity protein phosphatase family protein [Brucella]MDX4073927.1 dual specificity protein phosphatase family protein [Brucella sp. NBRC 113783]RLL75090.1 protein tyrosine phosphatase [[Ochrobactrum] soli]RRD27782.1 protein tyrosine phosphatase [Brucellaceae bacterium VT-16-1752]
MSFFKIYAQWSINRVRIGALAALTGASMLGGYLYTIQYNGNVHEIVPGEAYRSNQPDPARIAKLQKAYGIKTIINLRGPEPGADWYDDEINASQALGIQHVDFEMSSSKRLSPQRAQELITLMQNAEKPILIHCKAGADRTGLAAALYVAAISKGGERKAEGQMSIAYGHFGFPGSPTHAMDDTFEELEPTFNFSGS